MEFLHILILLFGIVNSQDFNATIIQQKNVINPTEYYLIILGILVGTLIFMVVGFSLLYFMNKRKTMNRNINHLDDNRIYMRNILNPLYDESYDDKNTDNEEECMNEVFYNVSDSESFEGFNINEEYIEVSNTKLKRRLSTTDIKTNKFNKPTLKKSTSLVNLKNKISNNKHYINIEPFNENDMNDINKSYINKNDSVIDSSYINIDNSDINKNNNDINKNEIDINKNKIDIKKNNYDINKTENNKNPSKKVNIDTIGKNKNNLMDELRKSLPNLIPKNMINN